MNIVNLTPHSITIMNEENEIVRVIQASSQVARLDSEKEIVSRIDGIDFYRTHYGAPVCINDQGQQIQFPEQEANTIYIVSGLFRSGYDRPDLWQPGELLRDDEGRPIGCIGLSQ